MIKIGLLALTIPALPLGAQTRWCQASIATKNFAIHYPPIARAAHVSGVVVGRVRYTPSGQIEEFEPIFGPFLLSKSVADQTKGWIVQTPASGSNLCQSLVIIDFSQGKQQPINAAKILGSIQVAVHAEELVLYSMPAIASAH